MADLLIPDIDDAVVRRLEQLAQAEGVSLDVFAGRILCREAFMPDPVTATEPLTADLAAMRATQPRQDGNSAADVRALRDGGAPAKDANQAA
ncbi:hypothetical protein [Roseicella aquatilis]|uniref:Uncharacterized protein n=1 Tax=Roseicella aquatilis TaxID=2527868 RepID=A0A4R4DEE2_9PROT|nr:hypothetical protein [Roseicella aquatilis]TCZ57846.1 hypothetical protein EXY23_17955 [Roseicella aquatilis]